MLFTNRSDVLTKQEAIDMLTAMSSDKQSREATMLATGYPAYTTAAGEGGM